MLSLLLTSTLFFGRAAFAFDVSRSDNIALYWGQDSAGGNQMSLSSYCQDASPDIIPIAFLYNYGGGAALDLETGGASQQDVEACQANGKALVLSLGGGGSGGHFDDDTQARQVADDVWNRYLGGSSSSRPFGSAQLDGIDLDIEGGGSTGYIAFVQQLQNHFASADKKYYITGAPQCPFPDQMMGDLMNTVPFDMVFVQFYNNYCGLGAYDDKNTWNFGTWDNWAKTVSPNPDVKVYIGAPASSSAAGDGYVDSGRLQQIASETKAQYSSFGGVMFWDASQAWANGRIDQDVKNAISGGDSAPPSSTTRKSASHTATATETDSETQTQGNPSRTRTRTRGTATATTKAAPTTALPEGVEGSPDPTTTTDAPASTDTTTSSSCTAGAWDPASTYWGGDKASFNGHAYHAKWWTVGSEPDTPQNAGYDVWVDDGDCSLGSRALKPKHRRGGDHRRSRLGRRTHTV